MPNFSEHPLYGSHNIDSAMGSLWNFYKKHFVILVVTSFIVNLIAQIIMTQVKMNDLTGLTDISQLLDFYKNMMIPLLEVAGVSILFNLILQYYVIYSPVEDRPNILSSALRSMKYLPAYLILVILFGFMASIALVLGMFIFFVGAIFAIFWAAMVYMFILPVIMAEGTNLGNAISRVFSLSHKEFWKNLGWVALLILIILVFSIVSSALLMIPFTGSFIKMFSNPGDVSEVMNFSLNPLYIGLSALLSSLVTPLMPVFSAILYFNAIAKENKLASVIPEEPQKVRVEDLYAKPYSDDHPDNPDKLSQPTGTEN
jgi:hypothetical protein